MDIRNVLTDSLPDTISEPSKLKDVTSILKSGNEIVIMVLKGQAIPLEINLSLPIAKTEAMNTIIFTQDFFLYFSKNKMRISPDGRCWADIDNMKSMKSLFGFSKGILSVGFGADKETGAFISVGIETN